MSNDDLNPKYVFNTAETSVLSFFAKNPEELLKALHQAMANRGVDADGNWVGFEAARLLHGVK